MRALGFEPKKEEIKKMIADIDKEGSGMNLIFRIELAACVYISCSSCFYDWRKLLTVGDTVLILCWLLLWEIFLFLEKKCIGQIPSFDFILM